jgi:hypothetical protein
MAFPQTIFLFGALNPVLPHLGLQGIVGDPHDLGGPAETVVRRPQRTLDRRPLLEGQLFRQCTSRPVWSAFSLDAAAEWSERAIVIREHETSGSRRRLVRKEKPSTWSSDKGGHAGLAVVNLEETGRKVAAEVSRQSAVTTAPSSPRLAER